MRRLKTKAFIAVFILIAVVGATSAGQSPRARKGKVPASDPNSTVIYHCTDASGMLSIQSAPCPRGQHQERSVIARPLDPLPSPLAATSTAATNAPVADPSPAPAPATAPAPARPVDETPLPPPPLYRCHTPSGGSYVNETDSPPERCREVPLVNISGAENVPEHDARMQCVMERDRCDRIPDQDLCATWRQRLREAQAMLDLNNPELVDRATQQRDQSQRVIERSCLTQN